MSDQLQFGAGDGLRILCAGAVREALSACAAAFCAQEDGRGVEARDDPGHLVLRGARVAGEDEVERLLDDGLAGGAPVRVEAVDVGEAVQRGLDRREADEGVEVVVLEEPDEESSPQAARPPRPRRSSSRW